VPRIQTILKGPSHNFWNLECLPLSSWVESHSRNLSSILNSSTFSYFFKYFFTVCCLLFMFSNAKFLCSSRDNNAFILWGTLEEFNSLICNISPKEESSSSVGRIASWPYTNLNGVNPVLYLVVVRFAQRA
jgi:hypothetical protein